MKALILGVNGFIGNALAKRILASPDWDVAGMDLGEDKVAALRGNSRFHFERRDMLQSWDWIDRKIAEADAVLPLVAIATPELYVKDPLRIFELDFEANMRVVRLCAKYKKRVLFPSTSEVYGMCPDAEFDEDKSNLVMGPVPMTRWIYGTSKQLLDRVIWAYGEKEGLPFTLFRPFNWVGPHLDTLRTDREVKSRSLTEFIANLLEAKPIVLVDGGKQRRAFIDVEEGVECLYRILADGGRKTDRQIINIGFPENEHSIEELAKMTREEFVAAGGRGPGGNISTIEVQGLEQAYGKGYQDVQTRRPSIAKAKKLLDWSPQIRLRETVRKTVRYYWEIEGKKRGL